MNDELRTSQLAPLTISFILGSTLLITMIDGITSHGTWMVVIAGFAISLPFLLIYAHLVKRFPEKSLIQMNDIIFGKSIGKVISAIYLAYFFLLLTFNINDVAEFYTGYIMPDTPNMVFLVVTTLVCAFAVQRGIAAIAKMSLIIVVFAIAVLVATTLMLIGNMDFSNLLPLFDLPFARYVQATHIIVELPFLEIVSFLMVTPMIKENKKLTRSWALGAAAAALMMLTIVLRNTLVLGGASNVFGENSFEAVRLINIGEFLTRIELLIAINTTALLFMKSSVLYYATVKGIAQLLGLERHNALILPIGSILVVFAYVKVDSAVVHSIWGAQYAPIFSFPCTIFFPLLMLILATARNLRTPPPERALSPRQ